MGDPATATAIDAGMGLGALVRIVAELGPETLAIKRMKGVGVGVGTAGGTGEGAATAACVVDEGPGLLRSR